MTNLIESTVNLARVDPHIGARVVAWLTLLPKWERDDLNDLYEQDHLTAFLDQFRFSLWINQFPEGGTPNVTSIQY